MVPRENPTLRGLLKKYAAGKPAGLVESVLGFRPLRQQICKCDWANPPAAERLGDACGLAKDGRRWVRVAGQVKMGIFGVASWFSVRRWVRTWCPKR